ncbi:MAG: 5'-3'-deoxyribonucleotidase [Clostridiales bacterium]|nr:5'-3'-deoxyribonucleotidase [Clostridiales bacterium]
MNQIKTLAFDMDEVITDTLSKTITLYNQLFQKNITKQDLVGKRLSDTLTKEQAELLHREVDKEGFFRDLAIKEKDTKAILEELNKKYKVFICTAAMEVPNSLKDKYLWLKEELPFLNDQNYVFCGDKSILATDYLVDDSLYQLEGFKGQGILFTAPHNQLREDHSFVRLNNWNEVAEYFL